MTAAYGRVMGDRVFITTDDPQVAKAVDVLPKARDLAMGSATQEDSHKSQPQGTRSQMKFCRIVPSWICAANLFQA